MKNWLLTIIFLITAVVAYPQKLPGVQTVSLRAPANIKVDGQATEWGNQYQAYNKSTEIFYTIANDDDNLYVVIHATTSRIIEKIIEGGISFTVSSAGKKEDKNNVMILFPLLSMNKARSILLGAGKTLDDNMNSPAMQRVQPELAEKQTISIARANKDLSESLKEIKLTGISAVTDTVPSVNSETPYYRFLPMRDHHYKIIGINNQYNIKPMLQFDAGGACTYELALPIKYLAGNANESQKIKYNITINGRGADRRPNDIFRYTMTMPQEMLNQDLENPTDFWGEYTIAKKSN